MVHHSRFVRFKKCLSELHCPISVHINDKARGGARDLGRVRIHVSQVWPSQVTLTAHTLLFSAALSVNEAPAKVRLKTSLSIWATSRDKSPSTYESPVWRSFLAWLLARSGLKNDVTGNEAGSMVRCVSTNSTSATCAAGNGRRHALCVHGNRWHTKGARNAFPTVVFSFLSRSSNESIETVGRP